MPMGTPFGSGARPTTPDIPPQIAPVASYQLREEDFTSLGQEWLELLPDSPVDHIFLTPYWTAAWWHHLSNGELRLLSLRREGKLMAVAPLMKRGRVFCLAADSDLCDYADIIVRRGEEAGATAALLEYLTQHGTGFRFGPLLPQSPLLSHLSPLAQRRGYTVSSQILTPTVSLELPGSWEEYLETLSGKERHEVRRKLRRLYGADGVSFSTTPAAPPWVELFFSLFRASRADKARFLTPQREAFFRTIMGELEARGHLRLYFLLVAERPVAAALCFEYHDSLYLYNNGFDPQYAPLSPGLMTKVLALQDAIHRGKRVFDFLSGAEAYKLRLGGKGIPLFRLVGDRPPAGGGEQGPRR